MHDNPQARWAEGAWLHFPVSVPAGSWLTITATEIAAPNAVLSGLFLGRPQVRQGQVGLHDLDLRLTHRSTTDAQARTRVRSMSHGAQMPSAGARACIR